MVTKKRETIFQQSWDILKKNKILFIPNALILLSNTILVIVLFLISGLGATLLSNEYSLLDESFFTISFIFFFLLYFIISALVDNYFITMKYGLIKDVLLKKKTRLSNGIKFANQNYLKTIGIHLLSYLIIFIPLILLATVIFLLLPISSFVANMIFIPLAMVYFIYMGIRLIFVFPVMTFEKKGAYNSLVKDFHFVKAHAHHTILTWLIVVGVMLFVSIIRENAIQTSTFLFQQIYVIGLLVMVFIIALEFLVSTWEHVFIFQSYLVAKKGRKVVKKTLIKKKKLKKKR